MAYRAADNPDRMKALGGVVVVHAALAALILSGLTVHNVTRAVEQLKTFDIREVPPPPPPPPPPSPQAERAKENVGAAAKKALPTPVVAPPPRIVVPYKPPVTAAHIASTGRAATAGAATAGSGTGAGGSGNGLGGGGNGDFSGFTPARLVRNLGRSDYRLIAGGRLSRGRAMVSLRVEPSGQPTNCRIVRSSGNSTIDAGLCPLITRRVYFRPALNASGQPIPYQLQYVATWDL